MMRSLRDPQRNRDAHEAFDFLKRQDFLARLELHALFRHAIKAADIAAVRDADAQVVVDAAESVDKRSHDGSCKSIQL